MGPLVSLLALLAAICLAPTAVPAAFRLVVRGLEARRERRWARTPKVAPVGELMDGLRRLSRELATLPAGTPWARQQGTQMAYDNLLVRLCAALEIDAHLATAPIGWARDLERLRLEEAVHACGLRIHPVGS
ncbi:MAG: hypothetical protein H0T85_11955 [Geodermatophilaceae bacterium]|nr:hypothetical protein [Geodermatophilaceae bacterium]